MLDKESREIHPTQVLVSESSKSDQMWVIERFTVRIPEDERDEDLSQKLKDEWPGILQWMVEGAVEWGAGGLEPPEAVRSATQAYLESEDAFAAWLEECCNPVPNHFTSNKSLFESWQSWAQRAGEFVGTTTSFTRKLEARGFERHRTGPMRGFKGIQVVSTDDHGIDIENG